MGDMVYLSRLFVIRGFAKWWLWVLDARYIYVRVPKVGSYGQVDGRMNELTRGR